MTGDANMRSPKAFLDFSPPRFSPALGILPFQLSAYPMMLLIPAHAGGLRIADHRSPPMMADFSITVGGMLLLATGLRIAGD